LARKHLTFLAAILAAALASTGSAQQSAAPTPQRPVSSVNAPAERILNLDALKAELKQYHDCTCTCGCYARDLDAQADRAIAFLRQRAAHRRPQEKLALVLDIDETTLSNYKEMVNADFAFDKAAFDAWTDTAQAPVIPGTLRLYNEAQRLGVSAFFLTGRSESQRAATERNLNSQGFRNWQQLILRPAAQEHATALAFKSAARAAIAAQGYAIILNVGDQWSDLKGQPEAEFSVKYPNPYYLVP
jgi:acid phosphatase